MVDNFYGDAAFCGFVEGEGDGAVERVPGVGVDFRFEGGFQCHVGIVLSKEVGVADEEALFVVVPTKFSSKTCGKKICDATFNARYTGGHGQAEKWNG